VDTDQQLRNYVRYLKLQQGELSQSDVEVRANDLLKQPAAASAARRRLAVGLALVAVICLLGIRASRDGAPRLLNTTSPNQPDTEMPGLLNTHSGTGFRHPGLVTSPEDFAAAQIGDPVAIFFADEVGGQPVAYEINGLGMVQAAWVEDPANSSTLLRLAELAEERLALIEAGASDDGILAQFAALAPIFQPSEEELDSHSLP
jgi:hypothetical protein